MSTFSRAAVAGTLTLALAACGGGGGGSVFNPNPNPGPGYAQCSPNTSVTIARPQSGSYGVSTNIGSIEIVLSDNSNPVWNNTSQWTLALQSSFDGQIVAVNGSLNKVSDNSGPHPYPNDFYLSEAIPQLQSGAQYNVYLLQTYGGCSPVQIGQFNT